jgi:hypothetical protein
MRSLQRELARIGVISAACAFSVGVTALYGQDTAATRSDSTSMRRDTSSTAMPSQHAHRGMRSTSDTTMRHTGRRHWRNRNRSTAGADSATKWGYPVDSSGKAQNPPGYRGMERPAALPADSSAKSDSSAPADATSRINQRKRQDSSSAPGQNPPGYRGMERPAALDSMRDSSRTGAERDSTAMTAHPADSASSK